MKVTAQGLLPIGRFARISGLSIRTLRRYGELGLLEPAHVDEDTGYRYYSLAQAREAEAIRRLRSLDVPLEEIRAILESPPEAIRDRLEAHRARLEGRVVELRRAVAELTTVIEGKGPLVPEKEKMVRFEIRVDDVPEQRVLAIRERVHQDEMSAVVPRLIDEVRDHMQGLGLGFAGPPFCVCPFPDEQGMLETSIGWPVVGEVAGSDRIEPKTLPATRALVMKHVGPYDALSRSYRLMSELMEDNKLSAAGDPREIYVTDPELVADPNDYETLIVWPIGPEGELDPGEKFKKRIEV
ncbi:MAG TPA: MerR family transcriptional regulator [Gaiellaceae bacterium]